MLVQYRSIKSKERKNGWKYCTFCKPSKVVATVTNKYNPAYIKAGKVTPREFACNECIGKLTVTNIKHEYSTGVIVTANESGEEANDQISRYYNV